MKGEGRYGKDERNWARYKPLRDTGMEEGVVVDIFACGNCGVAILMPDCPSCATLQKEVERLKENYDALHNDRFNEARKVDALTARLALTEKVVEKCREGLYAEHIEGCACWICEAWKAIRAYDEGAKK